MREDLQAFFGTSWTKLSVGTSLPLGEDDTMVTRGCSAFTQPCNLLEIQTSNLSQRHYPISISMYFNSSGAGSITTE